MKRNVFVLSFLLLLSALMSFAGRTSFALESGPPRPEPVPQTGHTAIVESVAFSPDGKLLASASCDHTVKLWNVADGREVRTLSGHTACVESVAFSPDGKLLASASHDETVKLWNVAEGREVRTLSGHTNGVESVAFSPDGKLLASGSYDKTIKLWNVADGREVCTLSGHTEGVESVAFSPNGKLLASGSFDKTIKLWNVADGREVRTLSGHTSEVQSEPPPATSPALSPVSPMAVKIPGPETKPRVGAPVPPWPVIFTREFFDSSTMGFNQRKPTGSG